MADVSLLAQFQLRSEERYHRLFAPFVSREFDNSLYTEFRKIFARATHPVFPVAFQPTAPSSKKWHLLLTLFQRRFEKETGTSAHGMMLLLVDTTLGYTQQNVSLVGRLVFVAMEVARRREGAYATAAEAPILPGVNDDGADDCDDDDDDNDESNHMSGSDDENDE